MKKVNELISKAEQKKAEKDPFFIPAVFDRTGGKAPPPLTPEQKKTLDEVMNDAKKKALDHAYDPVKWDKPKGMSLEEYDAWKSRERQEKAAKKDVVAAKLKALPKKEKKEMPKDSFTLRELARGNDIDPRHARAVARANKDKLKVLEVAGKYVYANKDQAKVLQIIVAGLDKPKTSKKAASAKPAPKIPPGGVFTGKAKVKRPVKPAPVIGEKAKLKASIKPFKSKLPENTAEVIKLGQKKKDDANKAAAMEEKINKQARRGTPKK